MTELTTPPSLYERLGGENAIQAAVDLLYDKLLSDALLAPYFEALDMQQMVRKQIAFLSWAFGGPELYKGRDLREAHRNVVRAGIGDTHFDATARHLRDTLEELQIAPALIEEVMAIVSTTREAVLGG